MGKAFWVIAAACVVAGCSDMAEVNARVKDKPFVSKPLADFDMPWAMTFLPDGRILVTERGGRLFIVTQEGRKSAPLAGIPRVAAAGQGGLGDVVLHPDFTTNRYVYLSYAEPGPNGTAGTAVGRGKLSGNAITGFEVLWRQQPKVTGNGHFSGRIAFAPDGTLFITSGDRQKGTPAQDPDTNLGKVVHLTDSGGIPADNPFAREKGVKAQLWSWGHRNLLGLAFGPDGRLWEIEMGPQGGDEVNLIQKGGDYGWPTVSNGDDYDGTPIPDHPTRPEFKPPLVYWNPSVSPSGLIYYSGDVFPEWKGSLLLGGLSGEALIRVSLEGGVKKADRYAMGGRIREVEQGPDGSVWLLEDGGRLAKLEPLR
jgi:glucose/arabinose dehydrogenase